MAKEIKSFEEYNPDVSQMSHITKMLLGSSAFPGIINHFLNPENQKRFKKWKKQRRLERKLKKAGGIKK